MSYWPHSNPEPAPPAATTRPAHPARRTLTADGDSCPGACNRDWRKLPPDVQHTTLRVPGNPVWCSRCARGIRQALAHILDAYVQLELDKLNGTSRAGEHVSGSKNAPSPSAAADEQDEMVRRLTWWEDGIRDARGLEPRPARLPVTASRPLGFLGWFPRPPRTGPPPRRSETLVRPSQESATLAGTVRFLLAHLDWALAQPGAGEQLGQDLLRIRAKASRRAATAPSRERRPVPCPRCQLRTLVHEDGAEHVECENPDCGRLLTLDEYDKLAAAVARSEGTAASA